MPVDPKEVVSYVDGLALAAGVSKEQRDTLQQVLANEKLAKAIADGTMRQDDYSRNMDALSKEKVAVEGEKSKQAQWYKDVLATVDNNKKAVDERDAIINAYVSTYGELDDATKRAQVTNKLPDNVVTKEEFKKQLDELGQKAMYVTKHATRIAVDYFQRFGKVLDMDAFEKYAVESGVPIDVAYDRYIAPQMSEMDKTQREKDIAAAREEGRREALSKANLPIDPGPKQPHVFFDRAKTAPESKSLSADFVKNWQEAGAGVQTKS